MTGDDLPALHSFVQGLHKDRAVRPGGRDDDLKAEAASTCDRGVSALTSDAGTEMR